MEVSEHDRSQRSDDPQEKRNAPTVSKEKWHAHAVAKLSRGYCLIVGTQRRSANFYQPGKGYETCAFHIARQLVKEGTVVKGGTHYLGTLYILAGDAVAPPARPAEAARPAAEDDVMLLLGQEDPLGAGDENGPAAW
ncbi:MAG: hypothetical protein R3247_17950 [Rhodothermales bacterium]|nr:hypothetical protein [Rhodothermales bacterium]